ncbi:MAG: hypothetical protein R3E11_04465 [Sphingobium sp.]|nr:hypothetical protein [Sphingobium sp.]MCP5398749.1 hypothetical protein [Sphingomonas sp.]
MKDFVAVKNHASFVLVRGTNEFPEKLQPFSGSNIHIGINGTATAIEIYFP